ncbi:TPA: hypothetical protein RZC51_001572 [Burkholderia cenocepacia]|nr:hypothetical protein [Burkholderia cenocepacia]
MANPEAAKVNSVRPAALFNYAMLTYFDSEWVLKEMNLLRTRGMPESEVRQRAMALQPVFRLRGTIHSVFDGRYRFSRYFSPLQFNTPTSLESLFAQNDVELYDLAADPQEMRNLATERSKNGDLILAMNDQLNRLMVSEVGEGDGPAMMQIRDGKVVPHFGSHG